MGKRPLKVGCSQDVLPSEPKKPDKESLKERQEASKHPHFFFFSSSFLLIFLLIFFFFSSSFLLLFFFFSSSFLLIFFLFLESTLCSTFMLREGPFVSWVRRWEPVVRGLFLNLSLKGSICQCKWPALRAAASLACSEIKELGGPTHCQSWLHFPLLQSRARTLKQITKRSAQAEPYFNVSSVL